MDAPIHILTYVLVYTKHSPKDNYSYDQLPEIRDSNKINNNQVFVIGIFCDEIMINANEAQCMRISRIRESG
jgi:hypothetical protein